MSNDALGLRQDTKAAREPTPDTDCARCPLRRTPVFEPIAQADLNLIDGLKRAELSADAGELLLAEGTADGPLYTLLSGWAMRFKTLSDGRRQILNVLLPGDFIGLQQKMDHAARHGVQALTDVRLCSFARDAIWQLHRAAPSLGYDITWLAAHEQGLLDNTLLSVGRRNGMERLAAVLLALYQRARPFQADADDAGLVFPLTQQHLADALGLSLAHTHRSMRQLQQRGLVAWSGQHRLLLPKPAELAALAQLDWPLPAGLRPLI